jgi:hypothetical protein
VSEIRIRATDQLKQILALNPHSSLSAVRGGREYRGSRVDGDEIVLEAYTPPPGSVTVTLTAEDIR